MKPRCKPGDIAVIINQRNLGKLVTVIELYVPETRVDGNKWYSEGRPGPMWVVESLGGLFRSMTEDSQTSELKHTSVAISDSCLRPLRKGPGQDEMLRLTGKPKDKPVVAKKRGRPAKPKEVY